MYCEFGQTDLNSLYTTLLRIYLILGPKFSSQAQFHALFHYEMFREIMVWLWYTKMINIFNDNQVVCIFYQMFRIITSGVRLQITFYDLGINIFTVWRSGWLRFFHFRIWFQSSEILKYWYFELILEHIPFSFLQLETLVLCDSQLFSIWCPVFSSLCNYKVNKSLVPSSLFKLFSCVKLVEYSGQQSQHVEW